MPLWDLHSTKSFFTASEKHQLSKDINEIYTSRGLPPFYVNVRFTEHEAENMYNGGETATNTVIIRVEHLARHFKNLEEKRNFMKRADAVLNPVLISKGALWEYAITLVDRETWEINGLLPPLARTKAETLWVEKNWPVEYEEADNEGASSRP